MKTESRYRRPAQMRLSLDREPSFERAGFISFPAAAEAIAAIDAWPDWPGGRLALVGPAGSGKTHLARAWAARAGAVVLAPGPLDLAAVPIGPTLLEDVDRGGDEDALFHLINRADAGASLLITARTAPRCWPTKLPDLRSRLKALMVARLGPPDDPALAAILSKAFGERNIRPSNDVAPYLVRRIPRSVSAALAIVARIDQAAADEGRDVNRALVRQVLEGETGTLDLFE